MKKILLCSALLTSLGYVASAQTITNAGLETWHNYKVDTNFLGTKEISLTVPDSWFGVDSLIAGLTPMAGAVGIKIEPKQQIFKTDKAHGGTAAAEIKSANMGDTLGVLPGVLLNSPVAVDILSLADADISNILDLVEFTGGTAVNAKVDTVKAWIMVDDANKDNSVINVSAIKMIGDSAAVIGSGSFIIEPGTYSAYTQIAVPVTYTVDEVPERLVVAFVSSDIRDSVKANVDNTLYVDDVTFSYISGGSSIQQPLLSENPMLVYPNPANNQIYFNLNPTAKAEEFVLTIFDVTGKELSREVLEQQVNLKNVSTWARGNYFYTLTNSRTVTAQQGKFVLK